MEMINLKFILCIVVISYIYATGIHAGTEERQKQAEIYSDINTEESDEEGYSTESQDSDESDFLDEQNIDLELMAQQGELVKYKYVVIIFCKAMNSELRHEGKSHPTEIDQILQELENFQPQNQNNSGTQGLQDMGDLYRIFQMAKKSLLHYKNLLVREKRSYAFRAHYFRLLQWLKFNMRGGNNVSTRIEPIIDEILEPRDDDTQPKCLETEFLPDAMKKFQNECLQIKTLYSLQMYGHIKDEAISMFLHLAEHNGAIDEVELEMAYFLPSLDENVNQEYCMKTRQLLELILADLSHQLEKFRKEFRKEPEEILLYLNEAVHHDCHIKYERAKSETINLKLHNVTSVHLLRDTMILYNNAIEKNLLPGAMDEETLTTVLQLENFPIGLDSNRELETNALLNLSYRVIQNYHLQMSKFYSGHTRRWNNTLEVCYSRLIIWAYNQISRVNSNEKHLYFVLATLETIWKSLKVGYQSNVSLNTLMDESYYEIATLETLMYFCQMPPSSPITTNHHSPTEQERAR